MKGLQHRADMMFTGVDWHEEIRSALDSTIDGTHPLFVKSEKCGEVVVRNDIDQRLPSSGVGVGCCDSSVFTSNFASCGPQPASAADIALLSWTNAQHDSRTVAAIVFIAFLQTQ